MRWARWIYFGWCAAAVVYLLIANMRGYVPFSSSTVSHGGSHSGAGGGHGIYYHK